MRLAAWLALTGWLAAASALECPPPPKYVQPPRGAPPEPVKLRDAGFVRASDGRPVQMKAISWFGSADNATVPLEVLWSGGSAAAADMPAIAYRLRSLGFNSIRLPFTFTDLRAAPKNAWAKQGCAKVTLGAGGAAAPAAAGQQQQQQCRWYLPDSSSLDRYLWSLQWFAANGFYVLSEFRPAGGDAAARSEAAFTDAWRWLWRAVACLPNFKSDLQGRVFVSPLGGPDAAGLKWEAGSDDAGEAAPGLTELYLKSMDAVWEATPSGVLFFIEGAGQGGVANWGSGFTTDKAVIAVNDYSDPNPFFQALLKRPYRAAVVLSPSVYSSDAPPPPPEPAASPGMAVAHAAGGGPPRAWPEGPAPIKVMDTTFAYLSKEGYCVGSDCQKFPVAVGQFASKVDRAKELGTLNEFATYLAASDVPYAGVGTWRFWGFDDGGDDSGGGGAGVADTVGVY